MKKKGFIFDHRSAKITIADVDVGHWVNLGFARIAVVAFFQWAQYQYRPIAGIFTLIFFTLPTLMSDISTLVTMGGRVLMLSLTAA